MSKVIRGDHDGEGAKAFRMKSKDEDGGDEEGEDRERKKVDREQDKEQNMFVLDKIFV